MKFQSGEKKLLAVCLVAVALPLSVGVYLNRINATPTVSIPAPELRPNPNGYDLYVAAATAMKVANPAVDAVNDSNVVTDPKIIAQRYSLARKTAWLGLNAKGFGLFDQAMKTPSLAPPERGNAVAGFASYAKLRELARKKTIESNARWMSGDAAGALQSGLDAVQMGHDMRRGGVMITNLVGVSIGAIGRSVTHDTVEKLDAKSAKIAARRLEKLLETRWNLSQTLSEEIYYSQSSLLEMFKTKDWRSPDSFASSLGGETQLSLAERFQIYTIPKQTIVDDVAATFERDIANAKRPYLKQQEPLDVPGNPFQQLFGVSSRMGFNEARDLAGDQLLLFRLALRAYKMEKGAYPPALNALVPAYLNAIPADPFGGGEGWRYKLDGQNYLLWGIGPDGKDDGGQAIPRRGAYAPMAGQRLRLPPISTDSVGDYVAGKNG